MKKTISQKSKTQDSLFTSKEYAQCSKKVGFTRAQTKQAQNSPSKKD
jgi:hypothetical protein